VPPPPAARKGSSAAILGGVAVVVVAGVVGGAIMAKKGSGGGHESAGAVTTVTATATTTAAPVVDAGKPVVPEEDAGVAPVTIDAGPAHSAGPLKPAIDPRDQACREAKAAADRNDLVDARRHYASCDGPNRVLARSAIEQAEIREHPHVHQPAPPPPPPQPCRGRHCPR
jgi:hypothetical protein